MSIYEIAEILGTAFPKAFTAENAVAGFRCTGVWPFNQDVFKEDEFLASFVTDRQDPTQEPVQEEPTAGPSGPPSSASSGNDARIHDGPVHLPTQEPVQEEPTAGPSGPPSSASSGNDARTHDGPVHLPLSPEDVRPFPKAPPRKKKGGRKKGKSAILTSTPSREEAVAKLKKKKKADKPKEKQPKFRKRLNSPAPSDSESNVEEPIIDDDTDSLEEMDEREDRATFAFEDIHTDDYVLVKYTQKNVAKHFIGQVYEIDSNEESFEVKFLKRQPSKERPLFVFPDTEDSDSIPFDDIVSILPPPVPTGGTKRAAKTMKFDFELKKYFQ